jgi:hypothetical protein
MDRMPGWKCPVNRGDGVRLRLGLRLGPRLRFALRLRFGLRPRLGFRIGLRLRRSDRVPAFDGTIPRR